MGYSLPRVLIFDNVTQLKGKKITKWCEGLNIVQKFTYVAVSPANGQVIVISRVIVDGWKKRLEHKKGNGVEEIPFVP